MPDARDLAQRILEVALFLAGAVVVALVAGTLAGFLRFGPALGVAVGACVGALYAVCALTVLLRGRG